MIPIAVELSDFLSHRCENGQPAVFDFSGARLWSVSGDNGAGKSAIFDAMTWTLFNRHRDGSQRADRLICHGATSCRAAFTFAIDGERYRVERSLRRRGSARRSAARWDEDSQSWSEIPETDSDAGFAEWRDELLGLDYEAFTQSILLLQGEGDRLIRASSRERFAVLAQLVDLSSYEDLARRARDRASDARAAASVLRGQVEGMPPVEEEEREGARRQVDQLAAERTTREEEHKTQAVIVDAAIGYAKLTAEAESVQAEIEAAGALLDDAATIRAAADERTALKAARSGLRKAVKGLGTAGELDEQAAELRERLEEIDVEALGQTADAAERSIADARKAAAAAGRESSRWSRALPAIELAISRRLELAAAERELAQAGPSADAQRALAAWVQAAEELKQALTAARKAERAAARKLAGHEARLDAARQSLAEIEAGKAEAVCARCGQKVPKSQRTSHLAHAKSALAEREDEREAASAALEPLAAEHERAERAVEEKRDERPVLERVLTRAEAAEDRRAEAQRAARKALADRRLAAWRDKRATQIEKGGADELDVLLEQLRGEAEHAEEDAEQTAAAAAERDAEATAARKALASAEKDKAALELKLEKLTGRSQTARDRAETALADLPADWAERVRAREPDLDAALDDRLDALAEAPARLKALESAERRLTELRGAAKQLQRQLKGYPPERRVPAEAAEAELARRAEALATATTLVEQAQNEVRKLADRERERRERGEDLARAERTLRLAERLAGYLGRQGVQGQLLARAARTLEALANDSLRRLTAGALTLEIRPNLQRGAEELTIAARDLAAGNERTDAAFLSGSEKFRVGVAIAAAIGEFASGRRRIESLIVDEGFGSLDEAGRDDMIDELQRLAGILARVIVVSHQSEFQDRARFPHGYRLSRENGTTVVERYV